MTVWDILDKKSRAVLEAHQLLNYGTKVHTPPVDIKQRQTVPVDDEEDRLEPYANEMRKAPNR